MTTADSPIRVYAKTLTVTTITFGNAWAKYRLGTHSQGFRAAEEGALACTK